ncbi:hypothetical protein evm_014751 [Chilo suppressalis]|nr:hypothetical protein evm_014751 [Chilo suppressalis]
MDEEADTDSRLSMYSLDTLRINLHPKSSSSRDNHSSATSKARGVGSCNGRKSDAAASNPPPGKSIKKSPRRFSLVKDAE